MRSVGPWCPRCGHDYAGIWWPCPYCGCPAQYANHVKPFREISHSAIELFEACEARFYFKRIAKLPEQKNVYADLGLIGHEMIEKYLRHGEIPIVNDLDPKSTNSKMASAVLSGIPHLPSPSLPGLAVEDEFHFEWGGVRFFGYKDYCAPLDSIQSNGFRYWDSITGSTLIGDHKFCTNFDYAPTPDQLRAWTQSIIYAADDVRRGAENVNLNWVYMQRGGTGAMPVRATLTKAEVCHAMETSIVPRARRVLSMVESPPEAKTTRTDPHSCFKWGQVCSYFESCHVDKDQVVKLQLEKIMTSALDSLVGTSQPTSYKVNYNGTEHTISAAQLPAALAAGAKIVEPQAAAVNPPVSPPWGTAAPQVPTPAPTPAPRARRGRPPRTAAATSPAPAGAIDYDALADAIVEAIIDRLSGTE